MIDRIKLRKEYKQETGNHWRIIKPEWRKL